MHNSSIKNRAFTKEYRTDLINYRSQQSIELTVNGSTLKFTETLYLHV